MDKNCRPVPYYWTARTRLVKFAWHLHTPHRVQTQSTPHWWKHVSCLYFHSVCLLRPPPPAYTHSTLTLLLFEWSVISLHPPMPWIVQRQIMTTLIGLPQRYINSAVSNVRHWRWRGNWLSPVPLKSFPIKCDFSIPLCYQSNKNMWVQTLHSVAVTSLVESHTTWRTQCTNLWGCCSEVWHLRLRRIGKENKVGKQRSGWVGWSRQRVDMRKNMENLFFRKLYGLTCEVRSPDLFLQSVDVLSCWFKFSFPLCLHDQ